MTTTVTVRKLTDPAQLFCQYPGAHQPQPCHISLDLQDGELTADYNPEPGEGGTPAGVYHRRVLWVDIPRLTADAANALLDEVTPIAQRILDGATVEWDGNDHVGRLDDDASAALDELIAACDPEAFDEQQLVGTIGAADWYSEESREQTAERLGITADTTDEEIEHRAATEVEGALHTLPGVTILRGAESYLLDIRDGLRAAVRDELEEAAATLAELTERRAELIRRLKGWGDSDRAIAALADLSHTHVQRIVAAGA